MTLATALHAMRTAIPLDTKVLTEAGVLSQDLGLRGADRIVFASVMSAIVADPSESVFLNRNIRDFDVDAVKELLSSHNCTLVGSFDGGLEVVRTRLAKRP